MTPAQAHKQQVLAEQAAQNGEDINAAEPYRRLLASLNADRSVLSQIKAVSDKVQAKKGMILKYLPWLEDVYQAGAPSESDPVFTTALLWLIDIGDLDTAVPYILFAIKHGMKVQDDYRRDLPDLLVEELAEQLATGAALSPENHAELLALLSSMDDETGMHTINLTDIVRAKFFKACGERAEEVGDVQGAVGYYESALQYSDKIGVKSRIASLKKQLEG